MHVLPQALSAVAVGAGATLFMDLWLLLLKRLGLPTLDFALLGRWAGHLLRGRLRHDAIRHAAPMPAERLLGWLLHYAVGLALGALLLLWAGPDWLRHPTLAPALVFGLVSAALPLLVLQPALGAGIASRRTPQPALNVLRSLCNHLVFGLGLFLAARLLASLPL